MSRHMSTSLSKHELRRDPRVRSSALTLHINGLPCDLVDYSKGGLRVRLDGEALPAVEIEIYKQGHLLHQARAILIWNRDGEAGYAFE